MFIVNKNILLGVIGGIVVYKVFDFVCKFIVLGVNVCVVLIDFVVEFVSLLLF